MSINTCSNICMVQKKTNLLDMSRENLLNFFSSLGEKSFRVNQIMEWIYHRYCDDFNDMININQKLRNKLKAISKIHAPEIVHTQYSTDGTIKWSLQVDQQQIETVYIPEKNRATLCISSQIGCALQCTFCATGQQGFSRNLRVSEIVGQVWRISKIIYNQEHSYYKPITNIVMMGMGEPLLNLMNVVESIKIILDHFGFGFSKHQVTLSTSGIVPALDKLSHMVDISLAISLHAPNDEIRNKIMPINKIYNIHSFLSSVCRYLQKSNANKGRVTVEYVMLDHINDRLDHALQLVECLKNIPSKINLIIWNSFPNSIYERSSNEQIKNFEKILMQNKLFTTIRKIRGHDINAACGQLTGLVINRNRVKTFDKKNILINHIVNPD